jgi:hypothetical protein
MRLVSGHLKRMESVVQPSQNEWGTWENGTYKLR